VALDDDDIGAKFVDEIDAEALKFLTLVDGWSLSACPALVVCCAVV